MSKNAVFRYVAFQKKTPASREIAIAKLRQFLRTMEDGTSSTSMLQRLPGIRAMLSHLEENHGLQNTYSDLFEEFEGEIEMHLHPCFLTQVDKGIKKLLGEMLLQYWPELDATLLCFSHGHPTTKTGALMSVLPYVQFTASFQGLAMRPKEKATGLGRVTRVKDLTHLVVQSLGFFNVIIKANHLEQKGFSFVHDEWRDPNDKCLLGELLEFRYVSVDDGEWTASHPRFITTKAVKVETAVEPEVRISTEHKQSDVADESGELEATSIKKHRKVEIVEEPDNPEVKKNKKHKKGDVVEEPEGSEAKTSKKRAKVEPVEESEESELKKSKKHKKGEIAEEPEELHAKSSKKRAKVDIVDESEVPEAKSSKKHAKVEIVEESEEPEVRKSKKQKKGEIAEENEMCEGGSNKKHANVDIAEEPKEPKVKKSKKHKKAKLVEEHQESEGTSNNEHVKVETAQEPEETKVKKSKKHKKGEIVEEREEPKVGMSKKRAKIESVEEDSEPEATESKKHARVKSESPQRKKKKKEKR